ALLVQAPAANIEVAISRRAATNNSLAQSDKSPGSPRRHLRSVRPNMMQQNKPHRRAERSGRSDRGLRFYPFTPKICSLKPGWPSRPDLGKRWPSRLVASAEDRLSIKRNPHTSFAAASDCRTIAIYGYAP